MITSGWFLLIFLHTVNSATTEKPGSRFKESFLIRNTRSHLGVGGNGSGTALDWDFCSSSSPCAETERYCGNNADAQDYVCKDFWNQADSAADSCIPEVKLVGGSGPHEGNIFAVKTRKWLQFPMAVLISQYQLKHQLKTKKMKESMQSLFKMLDRDNNGEVTASELIHSVTELGLSLTDDEIDEMMGIADLDGNGKMEFSECSKLMEHLLPMIKEKTQTEVAVPVLPSSTVSGVRDLWPRVDHIAIIVSDISRSSAFYRQLGMVQMQRPDFDRFGAWFTMGNINLHLINGRPIVHPDDDLIVSHIAFDIGTEEKMAELMRRLDDLGVAYRENVSVPKGSGGGGKVKQAFVRDPDGYYLEFCSCKVLENYLDQTQGVYDSAMDVNQWKKAAEDFKEAFESWRKAKQEQRLKTSGGMSEVDPAKLEKLLKRQAIYGDITQSASKEHLEDLLTVCNNDIPEVIKCLMEDARAAGGRTFSPPAFFERDMDHTFIQPPSFQMTRQ